MAKTTDEIYDLLVGLDKKVEAHIQLTSYRLDRIEERARRPWQFWLAVAGSAVSLPVSLWAASKGIS